MVTFPPNLICHTTVSPLARSISSNVRLLLPIACSAAVLMASARPSWADGSLRTLSPEACRQNHKPCVLNTSGQVSCNARHAQVVGRRRCRRGSSAGTELP